MVPGSRRLFRSFALLASLVVGLVVLTALQIPAAQAASTAFSFTGGEQQYTVPLGITAVTITAVGAPGSTGYGSGSAGLGASITATISVTGGETLYVEVGGTNLISSESFNGGGEGLGSGGGGSDVRTCAMASCSLATNDTRLVVAGGGGGGGVWPGGGGNAGDISAVGAGDGACGLSCDTAGGDGGFGGAAGGLKGGNGATDGSLGNGGDGLSGSAGNGGGGGGGYFGGGGGGYDGGGGGGSSYWIPSATDTSVATAPKGTPAGVVITTLPNITIGTALPEPTFHSSYSTDLSASGGQAPYTFALTAGSLPGLILSSDGTLSGAPNAAGPFFFTVTATDANGVTGAQNEELIVGPAPQAITFTTTPPVHAVVGGPTYTVGATGGGSGNYINFSTIYFTEPAICTVAGSVVSFISPGTCVIAANQPALSNQSGFLYYSAAPQVEQTFTVYAGPATQTIAFTSTPPSNAMVHGAPYTASASASSGLPVTLSINASATSVCSITGSIVTFNGVGLCVLDANQSGNADYLTASQAQQSMIVHEPTPSSLMIATLSLPSGTPRTRYDIPLVAVGGNPRYKWSIVVGALPPGLHMKAATGTITGRLGRSDSGTYTFTVKVVDRKVRVRGGPTTQHSAVQVLSITVS